MTKEFSKKRASPVNLEVRLDQVHNEWPLSSKNSTKKSQT